MRKRTTEEMRDYQRKRRGVTTEKADSPPEEMEGVTYPPLVHVLANPVKREKLIRICKQLKVHNMDDKVWFGLSSGLTMKGLLPYLECVNG